jgi:hypothetical protein
MGSFRQQQVRVRVRVACALVKELLLLLGSVECGSILANTCLGVCEVCVQPSVMQREMTTHLRLFVLERRGPSESRDEPIADPIIEARFPAMARPSILFFRGKKCHSGLDRTNVLRCKRGKHLLCAHTTQLKATRR